MRKPARLSSKNQVTIPREVRDALGLKAGERVVFQIENGDGSPTVTLRRHKSLQEMAGSVPTPEDVAGLPWEEIRARAWAPAGQSTNASAAGD